MWDANTGREVATLAAHGGVAHSCAWSPDGTRLASASDDTTVQIWDVTTGREVGRCRLAVSTPALKARMVSALLYDEPLSNFD